MIIIMSYSYLMLLFSLAARLTPLVVRATYVWVKQLPVFRIYSIHESHGS
jgi:hypothetical protein